MAVGALDVADPRGRGESRAPRATYCVTVVVGVLLLVGFLLCFATQVVTAALTLPLLCCRAGKHRFYYIQSVIFRGVNSFFSVALNPFWSSEVWLLGEKPGPPSGGKGSVIFMNHRSSADPWFSAWALTRHCWEGKFVYKSSLKKVPLFGWLFILAGDLAVERGDKTKIVAMLDQARDELNAGYNVVVFPEGTRSPSGIMQDFKPGFFGICAELGCPAIPAVMVGTERAWPLSGMKMACAHVRVAIGDAIYASAPDAAAELSKQVEERMLDMAHELLEASDGAVPSSEADDPYLTGRPYSYWVPPASLNGLDDAEQLRVLRSGGAHQRGANLL